MRSGFICSECKQKVLIAKLTSAKKKKTRKEKKRKTRGQILKYYSVWSCLGWMCG